MTTTSLTAGRAGLAAAVVLALSLSACSGAKESTRDDSGAIIEANENASAFDMRVGDCYDEPDATEVEVLTALPCDQEHDMEVYHAVDLEGGSTFPGRAEVDEEADLICYEAFEDFVGTPYEESQLDFYVFSPSSQSWADGDREIVCLVADFDGAKLTGTQKGSGI